MASVENTGELTPEDLFTCRQCGDCCRGYGGTRLTSEDIAAIAAFTGIPERDVADNLLPSLRHIRHSGPTPERVLHLLGPTLYDSSGEAPHVPKVAVYRKHPRRSGQLADHGGFLPGDAHGCPERRRPQVCRQGAGSGVPARRGRFPGAVRAVTASGRVRGRHHHIGPRCSCHDPRVGAATGRQGGLPRRSTQ